MAGHLPHGDLLEACERHGFGLAAWIQGYASRLRGEDLPVEREKPTRQESRKARRAHREGWELAGEHLDRQKQTELPLQADRRPDCTVCVVGQHLPGELLETKSKHALGGAEGIEP